MKISACLIIKDDGELEKLKRAYASLVDYVDGIYVTSTGKDIEQTQEWCMSAPGVHYSHFVWNDDFAAARNFNFSQAPQDSDYLFWMDSDDILVGGDYLRSLAELSKKHSMDVVFLSYWYACTFNGEPSLETLDKVDVVQMRERLIRPGTNIWKGRLHETPVPVEGVKNKYTKYTYDENERPIAILHTAVEKELPKKMERNKRILELQLEEERAQGEADPRTLIYLMKIYAEQDNPADWAKVLEMGDEYLAKSGWDEERGAAWEQMGIVYGLQGNSKKSIDCFHNAIKEWPDGIMYYLRLAVAYYNDNKYSTARHWLELAATMDLDKRKTASPTNFQGIKAMFADLLVKLSYNVDKDTKKALEAAKLLYHEHPTKGNEDQVLFLQDLNDLNDACQHFDRLSQYLDSIGQSDKIVEMLDILPDGISDQPFAHKLRQRFSQPRKWASNEICYFATFGGKHFEEWSHKSLSTGIGGSETAVIRLAQEWVKLGYKVTIYGDPGAEKGEHEGITWLPWYYFNPRDYFNVFIQWRSWELAGKIKCKKFLVDLHDIYSAVDIRPHQLKAIDKFMVKSKYHRMLAQNVSDEKFEVISNGI